MKGFAGAKFKKFSTLEAAQQFVGPQPEEAINKTHSPPNTKSYCTTSEKSSSSREYSDRPNSESTEGITSSQSKHQQFYYAVAKGRTIGIFLSW